MDLARQIRREGGVEQFKRNREDALRIAEQRHIDPKEIVRSVTRAQEMDVKGDLARVVQQHQVVKAEDIRRLYELMNTRVRIPEDWLNLKKTLDQYGQIFQGQMREIERSLQPYQDLARRLHTEGQRWAESINSLTEQFRSARGALAVESSSAWRVSAGGLAERLRELNMLTSRPQLASRMMAPTFAYSGFASRTLERLESPASEQESNALAGSLVLADEQIVHATSILEAVIEVPEEADRTPSQVLYNVLDEQQSELLIVPGGVSPDSRYEELSARSVAARISEKGRRILALVNRCNAAVRLRGDRPMFTPTFMVMEAYTDLPWILANTKGNFTIFINYLYAILYEGAGSQNLRFVTGNFVRTEECEGLWKLKHLRNKWLDHDIEHGSESSIRRSWADLGESLRYFGFNNMPQTPADFIRLQQNVLEKLESFLSLVAERTETDPSIGH